MLNILAIRWRRAFVLLRSWPWCLAFAFALFAAVWEGPSFWQALYSSDRKPCDFFQEWASAKNRETGLPVYSPHQLTIPLYLGRPARLGPCFIEVNAHPPVSVLLALPLTGFDYSLAHSLWNVLSLAAFGGSIGLIVRGLKIEIEPRLGIVLVLVLLSWPMVHQLHHGQLNLVLLLLLTGAWWADRSERPIWAGTWLGMATAIKFFPGLLFLYLVFRRRWQALAASMLSLAVCSATALAILGPEAFRDYGKEVLPAVAQWRSDPANCSLPGLCNKLFNPGTKNFRIEPHFHSPLLASSLTAICYAIVLLPVARATWRARSREEGDRAFALTLTAMLLLSPITWDHYFLLLMLPLALLWKQLPPPGPARWALLGIVALMWIQHWRIDRLSEKLFGQENVRIIAPGELLTTFSLHLYALLGLFVLLGRHGRGRDLYESRSLNETNFVSRYASSPS